MSPGHDAAQMLLKAQIRFAGESVGVRLDCSQKAFYFPLDFVFRLDLILPCGVGYPQNRGVMLFGLHALLPAIGLNLRGPHTWNAMHTFPFWGFSSLRKFL
jgi:hypothetical protein